VAIYFFKHVFVGQNPRRNVSAGRTALNEKFFGGHIFNLLLRFCVKIQLYAGFQILISARCFRRAETFLPGQSDDEGAAFCGYIHVQVLSKEGFHCFVKLAGNVQGHAFILVYSFVSEVLFSRNPALNSNYLAYSPCKNYVFIFGFIKRELLKQHSG